VSKRIADLSFSDMVPNRLKDERGLVGVDIGEYKGEHTAPMKDGGAPLWKANDGIYPDDIYSSMAERYYGDYGGGHPMDRESISIIQSMKGKPDKQVRVYRAIPKGISKPSINTGDWVTISKRYAKAHGEGALNGEYRIVSKLVSARDIFTDGNSIHEWGYDPQPYVPISLKSAAEQAAYKARVERAKAKAEEIRANRGK
jgi:hypothetical protein